jgi:hypothetical protein
MHERPVAKAAPSVLLVRLWVAKKGKLGAGSLKSVPQGLKPSAIWGEFRHD